MVQPHIDELVDLLGSIIAAGVAAGDFAAADPTAAGRAVLAATTRFHNPVHAAEWREDGDVLELWITADTFMRHMNRVLVGTMVEVATGKRTLDDFVALLEGRPRSHAGATAPPHGLALASVGYAE